MARRKQHNGKRQRPEGGEQLGFFAGGGRLRLSVHHRSPRGDGGARPQPPAPARRRSALTQLDAVRLVMERGEWLTEAEVRERAGEMLRPHGGGMSGSATTARIRDLRRLGYRVECRRDDDGIYRYQARRGDE